MSSENSLREYGWGRTGSETEEEEVYMMGRRLDMVSGGPMKLSDGLDVWRRRLQPVSMMRGDMLVVA